MYNDLGEMRSNTGSRPGTGFTNNIVNEKAQERHYDGKIYPKTLLYGHRLTNVVTYFNDRLPRLHRLLMLYVNAFLMLLLSGVFFFVNGDKNDVGGYGIGHAFAFAIVTTIFDWLIYIIFMLMFMHKPYPERFKNYMRGSTLPVSENSNSPDNVDPLARPFTVGKAQRFKKPKEQEIEVDDDKKSKDFQTTILVCITTGAIIISCWAFIITMSITYTEEAGKLWGLTFLFTLILDPFLVEFYVLYKSSKMIYNNKWDIEDKELG
jgi:hypothetical protein